MDNTALCWGQQPGTHDISFRWQETPPREFSALEAAGSYTCGVHLDGMPQCWGYVSDVPPPGHRNVGSFERRRIVFKTISVQAGRGCGLWENGQPVCWGEYIEPYTLKHRFIDISAGGNFFCAIRKDSGVLTCWGDNQYGQALPPDGERIEGPAQLPDR